MGAPVGALVGALVGAGLQHVLTSAGERHEMAAQAVELAAVIKPLPLGQKVAKEVSR